MALLWLDGFESIGTSIGTIPTPTNVLAGKYTDVGGESFMDIEAGRGGGKCLEFNMTTCKFRSPVLSTTNTTLIIGFAFKYSASVGAYLCNLLSNAVWTCTLYFDGNGQLVLKRNYTVLGVATCELKPNRWYWIEWKLTTHDTTGSCEIRVGNKTVLNLTNIDTKHLTYTYNNQVSFQDNGCHPSFDDLYICDGSGSDNNDFLGNGYVKTLRPDGDSSVQWTPTSGSNYDEVNEAEHDSGTTNVVDSTANNKDLYTYTDLSGPASVKGLMVCSVVALSTAGSETFQTVVSSSGSEVVSSNHTVVSTAYVTFAHVEEQDPNASSAWTDTTVDAALFGIKYI